LKKQNQKVNPVSSKAKKTQKWQPVPEVTDITNVRAVPNFPRITIEEIRETITCGNYQLKQASHYADDKCSYLTGGSYSRFTQRHWI